MALNTRMRPSTGTPNDGSRTITIRDSQPREEGDESADDVNADGVDQTGRNGRDGRDVGVLRLRGGPSNQPRVSWKEDVVDNEGMGKKKSKSEWGLFEFEFLFPFFFFGKVGGLGCCVYADMLGPGLDVCFV